MAGLEVEHYNLDHGKIDIDELKEKAKDCCGILINSPGNPTGTVQEIEVLKEIEKLANEHDLFVVSVFK